MFDQSPFEGKFDRTGKVCLGRVTNVDSQSRILRVKTIGMGSVDDLDLHDVHVLHGLWHAEGDESVTLPRRGAMGVVLFLGSESIWIGSIPSLMAAGAGQRTNLESLNEGDIAYKTKFGNKVILRTGGTIEIQSTRLCKTFWIPSENLISNVCQNFEVETSGGFLKWNLDKENANATKLSLKAWNSLTPDNAVTLDIGTITENNNEEVDGDIQPFANGDLILDFKQGSLAESLDIEKRSFRMSLKKDGSMYLDIGPSKFTMKIDAATGDVQFETKGSVKGKVVKDLALTVDGSVTATVKKDITINAEASVVANVKKDLTANVKGKATIAADGVATVSSKADVTVDAKGAANILAGGDVSVTAKGSAKVDAATVDITAKTMVNVKGNIVNLGGGGLPVARVGDTAIGTNGGGPMIATIMKGSPKVTSG